SMRRRMERKVNRASFKFMKSTLLCASLFAAEFASIRAEERDPAVAAAPFWKCGENSEMVIWRAQVGAWTGPIARAGGKLFVGISDPKIENPPPDRDNNRAAL